MKLQEFGYRDFRDFYMYVVQLKRRDILVVWVNEYNESKLTGASKLENENLQKHFN